MGTFVFAVLGTPLAVAFWASAIAFLAVFGCGCPAVQFVAGGITIIEQRFPMKEYVEIKPKIYCPLGPGFYGLSWRQNLLTILGKQWWVRLVLPVPASLDIQAGAVWPEPSLVGDAALKKMIKQVEEKGVEKKVHSVSDLGINEGPLRQNDDRVSSFDGSWERDDGHGTTVATIQGDKLCWARGSESSFKKTSGTTCEIEAGFNTVSKGTLSGDGKLHWDDGEVWTRCGIA